MREHFVNSVYQFICGIPFNLNRNTTDLGKSRSIINLIPQHAASYSCFIIPPINNIQSQSLSLSKLAAILNENSSNNKLKYSASLKSHVNELMVVEYQYDSHSFLLFLKKGWI